MADKEFQVRHGLIVNNTVLVANTITNNVGIGRANPGYALDVVGTANAANLLINGNPVSLASTTGAAFDKANSANILAFNTGAGANAYASGVGSNANLFASATIAGANAAVGSGANSFATLATIAANNFAGTLANAANSFMISTLDGANTAVGAGANAFASATIAGANTAVGAGANAFTSATIAGANNAVGSGANAFATAATVAANNFAGVLANSANAYANGRFLANTTGATFEGNLNVTANLTANTLVSSAGFIDLGPGSRPANVEGRIYYDNIDKSLTVVNDTNFKLPIGQIEYARVYNQSGATLLKGKAVYATGFHTTTHHHFTVDLADASDPNKYDVIGLVAEDIPNNTHGYVIVRGWIGGINTASLTAGTRFHLGYATPGSLVTVSPEYPNYPYDIGYCIISDSTNGYLYVDRQTHTIEGLRVTSSARIGGDMTVEGNFTVLGSENAITVNSLEVGTQFIYLGSGDSIPNSAVYFVGSGLNDIDFQGHYTGNTNTSFYVMISDVSPDKFSWGYNSNFTNLVQANVVMQYQTAQPLSNGISVYFNANTGHTVGDKWNATAFGVSTDFGVVGNHIDGPNGYTHAGLFRDATDGTFKFFRSYDPEVNGNIDIANTTFALANLQVNRITASEIYEGGSQISTAILGASITANQAFDKANAANVLAFNTGVGANAYAAAVGTSANAFASATIAGANAAVGAGANAVGSAAFTKANNAANVAYYRIGNTTSFLTAWSNAATANIIGANGIRVAIESSTNSVNVMLTTTGVAAATYGGTSNVGVFTVDSYGRITSASNVAISGGSGGAKVNVGSTTPTNNTQGDLWWNAEEARLFLYYNDGDSAQWVEASPGGIIGPQGIQGIQGDIGPTGPQGNAAQITIATSQIVQPNIAPSVTNLGNTGYADLQFSLPRAYNVYIQPAATVLQPNQPPTVTNSGNTTDFNLTFNLPRAYNVYVQPAVSVLQPDQPPTVTNSGNTTDFNLTFSLPRAYTVTTNNTITIPAGQSANVNNSPTANSTDLKLDFYIPQGTTGDKPGLKYTYDGSTANSDPGAYKLKYNNTLALFTSEIYINEASYSGAFVGSVFDSWNNSTTPNKGILTVTDNSGSSNNFDSFYITDVIHIVSAPEYYILKVSYVGSSGGIANLSTVALNFSPSGNRGLTGNTGNTGPMGPKTISIPGPQIGDSYTIMWSNTALTLNEIRTVVQGTNPNVEISIFASTDRSNANPLIVAKNLICSNVTFGNSFTTLANNNILANAFIWLYVANVNGTVTESHTTLRFNN